jgi:hypothetical protein
MNLQAVKGGWVNKIWMDEMVESKSNTIVVERKSKYKHKVVFSGQPTVHHSDIQQWCEQTFGPGGRSKKCSWRFGWTDKTDTYYFKSAKDATIFALRWA